jgi:hypothetical protein
LIIDEVNTSAKNQEMEFNFHTPCSMTPIDDGYISVRENGFLVKQDRLDVSAITKSRSMGAAGLGDLPGEVPYRDIDWLVFRKQLKGDRRSDRMATLIYPFASKEQLVPADVSVERIAMKDDVAIGYRVRTGKREDTIIASDGKYRKFTDGIEGDFTYARISSTSGVVDYAGFSGVTKYRIPGITDGSFKTRKDHEYTR